MSAITYKAIEKSAGIRVLLNGKAVGTIQPMYPGFAYRPRTGKGSGDTFPTLEACKQSLESDNTPTPATEAGAARVSACCNAPIVVGGQGATHWFKCGKCGIADNSQQPAAEPMIFADNIFTTPAAEHSPWDRSGLKGAVERGIAIGRTHEKMDLYLLRDMLTEIENGERAVNEREELIAALREILGRFPNTDRIDPNGYDPSRDEITQAVKATVNEVIRWRAALERVEKQ